MSFKYIYMAVINPKTWEVFNSNQSIGHGMFALLMKSNLVLNSND